MASFRIIWQIWVMPALMVQLCLNRCNIAKTQWAAQKHFCCKFLVQGENEGVPHFVREGEKEKGYKRRDTCLQTPTDCDCCCPDIDSVYNLLSASKNDEHFFIVSFGIYLLEKDCYKSTIHFSQIFLCQNRESAIYPYPFVTGCSQRQHPRVKQLF